MFRLFYLDASLFEKGAFPDIEFTLRNIKGDRWRGLIFVGTTFHFDVIIKILNIFNVLYNGEIRIPNFLNNKLLKRALCGEMIALQFEANTSIF